MACLLFDFRCFNFKNLMSVRKQIYFSKNLQSMDTSLQNDNQLYTIQTNGSPVKISLVINQNIQLLYVIVINTVKMFGRKSSFISI